MIPSGLEKLATIPFGSSVCDAAAPSARDGAADPAAQQRKWSPITMSCLISLDKFLNSEQLYKELSPQLINS